MLFLIAMASGAASIPATCTANSDCDGFDGFADTIKRIPSQRLIVKRFFQGFQRFAKRARRVRLFRHT